MLADGVVPTNEGRGYILRRLIRRAVRANNQLCDEYVSLSYLIDVVVDMYKQEYPELLNQKYVINYFQQKKIYLIQQLKKVLMK